MGPSEPITLRIAGLNWRGWKSVEISRRVDAACGSFSLGLADRWRHDSAAAPLAAGMPCQVLAGGDSLIDGYLDQVRPSFKPGSHGLTVSGRDKSGDLVDCSAVHSPGQFLNLTVLELAQALAAPFGVNITAEADPGPPLAVFKLEEGETAFAALDRALRMRGLLPLPDGRGGLRLAQLAQEQSPTALVQGRNVKEGSAGYDMADRFSDYIVKGQKPGTDEDYGPAAAAVRGEARDENVPRYRPLILRAESQVDLQDALKRAKWEASTRAARAVTINLTVQGWRQDDGRLWDVGGLVRARLPFLRLDRDLLIAGVSFSLSPNGGSLTRLELKDPKAFDPEPPRKSGGAAGGGKGGAVDLQQESADKAWDTSKEFLQERP